MEFQYDTLCIAKNSFVKNMYFVFLCEDPCTYPYGISGVPCYASMLIMYKVMTFHSINNVKAIILL